MFKRIGFSIACLLLMYLIYILYSTISTEDFINSGHYLVYCDNNSTESSEHFVASSVTLLASFIILIFDNFLKEFFDTCNMSFCLLNIGVAVMLLLIFTVFSYKYRYRKRDDICNIYQYAENYYSNYGTFN